MYCICNIYVIYYLYLIKSINENLNDKQQNEYLLNN